MLPIANLIGEYLSWACEGTRAPATLWPLLFYRGHECESWELLPTLCRRKLPAQQLMDLEKEIIAEVRNRFSLSDWKDLEVVAYARHLGAPTRLLDWSKNAFVALWFTVSSAQYDSYPGVVFQINVLDQTNNVLGLGLNCSMELDKLENCPCKRSIHVLPGSHRVERCQRQGSIFSIASFSSGHALIPMNQAGVADKQITIRKFSIPPERKVQLRRLLAELGLDAYSVYGDPDSFGKSLGLLLEF